VLDGNELSTYAHVQGSDLHKKGEKLLEKLAQEGKVNANFWNGGIGADQLSWLDETLANAEEKNQHVVIFCHFPIYPAHRHNLLNDVEVLNVIGKYDGVKIWFNGHNHRGNYGWLHDIHFVNVKGMVETEFDSAYCVVQLSEDRIQIQGFGTEMSARLSI
jgi:3',5'-cyclic AMP phosphodiesterase CpdA